MATKQTRSSKSVDAIALLKADHRAVEELFAKFEKSRSPDQKVKLAKQICLELSIHTTIEEEIFYPTTQDNVEEDIINEAYVEHDGAKMLIAEIMEGSPDERFYDAKVTVLSEEIKHHVKEEEQRDGLFAQAKKGGIDMQELGEQLAARKKELKASFTEDGVPPPKLRSMKGAKLGIIRPAA